MSLGAVKLLANKNFPGPAVKALRERGVDVLWVSESMAAAPAPTGWARIETRSPENSALVTRCRPALTGSTRA